jgi:hypothetical protein
MKAFLASNNAFENVERCVYMAQSYSQAPALSSEMLRNGPTCCEAALLLIDPAIKSRFNCAVASLAD